MFETTYVYYPICSYKENTYYFHRWFEEGNQKEGLNVGAILEDKEGSVYKVFDIEKIKFNKTKN